MTMQVDPTTGALVDDQATAGVVPETPAAPEAVEAPAPVTAETPVDEPVLPSANPAVPVVRGALPGLGIASQTLTAPSVTTTSKVVTPEIKQADKDVASAVQERKTALAHEAADAAEEARIKTSELTIEASRKEREANEAKAAIEDAVRRKAEVAAQAKRDQDALQAEAQRNHDGFFKDKEEGGGGTGAKILWALSLGFGAGAVRYGQENKGEQLLDKAMADWTHRRQFEVDRLGKVAAASGAAYQNFWANYGAEYQAQKSLKDAAGYAQVASQLRQLVADRGALMSAQAKTEALTKAATYDEKSAQDHQRAVDARMATQSVHQGGATTTLKAPTTEKVKNNNLDVYGPDGKPIAKAPTPGQATAVNKANAAYVKFDRLLSALQQSYREHGKLVWPWGKTDAERATNQAQAAVAFKNMAALGQISAGDQRLIDDAIAGRFDTGEQAVTKLTEARSGFQRDHKSFLATQGVPPESVVQAWRTPEAAAPAPKALPVTPADQGLLNQALSTRPGDPNYAPAQRWLRAHGR